MNESDELASEEFEVDLSQASVAWADGLSRGRGTTFLEKLENSMLCDPKFSNDKALITRVIRWLRDNTLSTPGLFAKSHVQKLQEIRDLSERHIRRLDYLVIQVESVSPNVSLCKKNSNIGNNASLRAKSHSRYSSYEDNYDDDDFCEIEDENNSLGNNDRDESLLDVDVSIEEEGEYAYEDIDETVSTQRDKGIQRESSDGSSGSIPYTGPSRPSIGHTRQLSVQSVQEDMYDDDDRLEDRRRPTELSQKPSHGSSQGRIRIKPTPVKAHKPARTAYTSSEEEEEDVARRQNKNTTAPSSASTHSSSHHVSSNSNGSAGSTSSSKNIPPPVRPSATPRTIGTPNTAKSTEVLPHRKKSIGSSTSSSVSRSSAGKRNKQPGWIERGHFTLGKVIGKGSFGEVHQCYSTETGKIYAAKKLQMVKFEEIKNLISEIDLMRNLQHENIVQYFGSKIDEEHGIVYIFLEWVPGGSVAHVLKEIGPFEFGTVSSYTRQILCGLEFLHLNGVIHRDIKGGNVLIKDDGTIKLADFGASTKLVTDTSFTHTQVTSTVKGTPYFMAPEVLAESHYGRKGDIWAVGCTMIQMLSGDPPWKDRNLQGLVQLHMLLSTWVGLPDFVCPKPITPQIREVLDACFQRNPDDRPTPTELLKFSFFNMEEQSSSDDDSVDLSDDDEKFERVGSLARNQLDESGTLANLRQQMERAVVSRGGHGAPGTAGSGFSSKTQGSASACTAGGVGVADTGAGDGDEDTMDVIEKQIRRREQREQQKRDEARETNILRDQRDQRMQGQSQRDRGVSLGSEDGDYMVVHPDSGNGPSNNSHFTPRSDGSGHTPRQPPGPNSSPIVSGPGSSGGNDSRTSKSNPFATRTSPLVKHVPPATLPKDPNSNSNSPRLPVMAQSPHSAALNPPSKNNPFASRNSGAPPGLSTGAQQQQSTLFNPHSGHHSNPSSASSSPVTKSTPLNSPGFMLPDSQMPAPKTRNPLGVPSSIAGGSGHSSRENSAGRSRDQSSNEDSGNSGNEHDYGRDRERFSTKSSYKDNLTAIRKKDKALRSSNSNSQLPPTTSSAAVHLRPIVNSGSNGSLNMLYPVDGGGSGGGNSLSNVSAVSITNSTGGHSLDYSEDDTGLNFPYESSITGTQTASNIGVLHNGNYDNDYDDDYGQEDYHHQNPNSGQGQGQIGKFFSKRDLLERHSSNRNNTNSSSNMGHKSASVDILPPNQVQQQSRQQYPQESSNRSAVPYGNEFVPSNDGQFVSKSVNLDGRRPSRSSSISAPTSNPVATNPLQKYSEKAGYRGPLAQVQMHAHTHGHQYPVGEFVANDRPIKQREPSFRDRPLSGTSDRHQLAPVVPGAAMGSAVGSVGGSASSKRRNSDSSVGSVASVSSVSRDVDDDQQSMQGHTMHPSVSIPYNQWQCEWCHSLESVDVDYCGQCAHWRASVNPIGSTIVGSSSVQQLPSPNSRIHSRPSSQERQEITSNYPYKGNMRDRPISVRDKEIVGRDRERRPGSRDLSREREISREREASRDRRSALNKLNKL